MSFQLAPKTFWWAELISQFFFNLNSSKNFTCLSGQLSSKFTSLIAKFPSPGLSDTTCFARWSVILILCYSQVRYIFQPCLHSHSLFYARGTCTLISRSPYIYHYSPCATPRGIFKLCRPVSGQVSYRVCGFSHLSKCFGAWCPENRTS